MPDVIVTGLPRSGATLVAALIDYLPQAVCLNNPTVHTGYAARHKEIGAMPYCKWLAGDFVWQRTQLLKKKPIFDYRAADGTPLMDGHDPKLPRDASGMAQPVRIKRSDLGKDFILGMKHHVLYTALLPTLVKFEHFKIIAVIRNPLDTLASWQRLAYFPLNKEDPPNIEKLWPEAVAVAESKIDPIDRMVQMYELHLERYHQLRKQIHIVKYEEVVQDPMIVSGLLGSKVLPANAANIDMHSRVRNAENTDLLRESLRKYGVFAKEYYGNI